MITHNKVFKTVTFLILLLLTLACILPILLMFMSSITDEQTLMVNGYSFFPEKFSLSAYSYIFNSGTTILRAYLVTIGVTAVGTSLNLLLTIGLSYPLSRPQLKGRSVITFLVIFTMLFNGGLVPTYICYSQIFHIKDTIYAQLIPTLLMSPFNVILMRNYFRTNIPDSIVEAAKIDGANEVQVLIRIALPLSTPIVGTVGLMAGLAYWNDWTNGLYYLVRRTDLYNIQNVLTNMLNNIQFLKSASSMQGVQLTQTVPSVGIRMAIAMVALIPVLIIYPFVQKSFVRGIVIGGVKG